MNCYICDARETDAVSSPSPDGKGADVKCLHCDAYYIERTAAQQITQGEFVAAMQVGRIRGWMHDQRRLGITPSITPSTLEDLRKLAHLPVSEKINRLLLELASSARYPPMPSFYNTPSLWRRIWGSGEEEVRWIASHLLALGYIEPGKTGLPMVSMSITPKGLLRAEEIEKERPFLQGFVAMWFHTKMDEAWAKGLLPGVEEAGYRAMKIDLKEFNDKIDDEILLEIKQSRFLVADFTRHRRSVYFEAGFALGLGIPVIWTCKKTHLKWLAFDIRQYNCIDWTTADELRSRLRNRILMTVGPGPNPT